MPTTHSTLPDACTASALLRLSRLRVLGSEPQGGGEEPPNEPQGSDRHASPWAMHAQYGENEISHFRKKLRLAVCISEPRPLIAAITRPLQVEDGRRCAAGAAAGPLNLKRRRVEGSSGAEI